METRKGAFWSKLGMKEVRTGNCVTEGPSHTNGTPVKAGLWRNGDSGTLG